MKKTTERISILIEKYEGSLDSPEAIKELSEELKDDPELLEKVASLIIEKAGKPSEDEKEQKKFENKVASYGLRPPAKSKKFVPPVSKNLEEKIDYLKK